MGKNHKEHCELYLKHQPKEEKEFYEESIRLHNEYEKELLSIPLNPTFNEEE